MLSIATAAFVLPVFSATRNTCTKVYTDYLQAVQTVFVFFGTSTNLGRQSKSAGVTPLSVIGVHLSNSSRHT
jgi:hypothetical protein